MLCIQRTLAFGLEAGLATGLAAATVQVTYGLIAVLGRALAITSRLGTGVSLLPVLSAAILFCFAIRSVQQEAAIGAPVAGRSFCVARAYREALLFGFANPLTVSCPLRRSRHWPPPMIW